MRGGRNEGWAGCVVRAQSRTNGQDQQQTISISYTLLAYYYFLTSTNLMDILKTKLQLLEDLSLQHSSTIQSVVCVRDGLEALLDHIEKQITLRSNEKVQFRTKVGLQLRESVLELFNRVVTPIHQAFCMTEEVYAYLLEKQLSIEEVIKHGHPMVQEIEYLSNFILATNQRYVSAKSAIRVEEESFANARRIHRAMSEQGAHCNKENRRTENCEVKSSKRQQGQKYKLNMLMIAREGNESFLKASQKLKQFQIMQLSLVIDECLNFVSDSKFIKQKILNSSSVSGQNVGKEHVASLGIQSLQEKGEEVDLLCDEQISFAVPAVRAKIGQVLHLITERQEQLQSDGSLRQSNTFESSPSSI